MALADIKTALRRKFHRFVRSSRGNMTMIAALSSIPVIAAAGMAVDYARISRVHDKMQLIADGAALAAVGARNLSGTNDQKSAQRVAIAKNYLTKGLASLTDVDVVGTPTVTAVGTAVNITATAKVKGSFMNVMNGYNVSAQVGSGSGGSADGSTGKVYGITVKSQASYKTGASVLCMLALNPTSTNSLEIQGTADIIAPACAVWVNSNHTSGLYENGNATLTAQKICVRGYYNGSNYFPDMPKSGTTDCPLYADPLAAKFATDYTTAWAAAVSRGSLSPQGGTATLLPGKYTGNVTINNGGRITLSPGIYFFVDGTLNIKAGGQVFATGGVSIIITKSNVSAPITDTSSKLTVQAQGQLSIKAPATGPFAGIAIAQHPNVIAGTTKVNGNNIQGGGKVEITGIVYYPKQILYITGSGLGTVSNPDKIATADPQFAIVADRIIIEGNGQLKVGGAADAEAAGLPALPVAGTGTTTVSLR